jgi:uncharacterized protein (DUF488 family)
VKVYSFGYGGRPPAEFIEILTREGVRAVVDVRLRPERASLGSYARAKTPDKGIEGLLARSGIAYHSMVELGNVFIECEDWKERYREYFPRVAEQLTARLAGVPEPFCLLCAERDASACHRQFILEYLASQGGEIGYL